jgi:hypothetical protein
MIAAIQYSVDFLSSSQLLKSVCLANLKGLVIMAAVWVA